MSKKLKVLLLFDSPYAKPRGYDFADEFASGDWDSEKDAYKAILANGHKVNLLGLHNNLNLLLDEVKESKPDLVFNVCDVFKQKSSLERNIAWLVEMLGIPYTGASPANLLICNDKSLSKKILRFHRIRTPRFHVFQRKKKIWLPKKLKLPLIVKPLHEEASRGISQASVVDNEEALINRVSMIHNTMKEDAIVEEYIDGRELHISMLGNKRLLIFPPRESKFGKLPDDEPRIATYKAKWDEAYRKKWGIKNVFAGKLPDGLVEKIQELCKRAYRALEIQSHIRFDIRVTPEGNIYIIEANANPNLERADEFAQSASKAGITYDSLIQRLIELALKRK